MKKVYSIILTIAILFSISFAPAYAAITSSEIVTAIGISILSDVAIQNSNAINGLVNGIFTDAQEKLRKIDMLNDCWQDVSRSDIVRYACEVSPDDLYHVAFQLNQNGFPCRIASFNASSYGASGTIWYIQGTGQIVTLQGALVPSQSASYAGSTHSFGTNISGKNFGDGLSRLSSPGNSSPRVFVSRFDYSATYLANIYNTLLSMNTTLNTVSTRLSSISTGVDTLVSSSSTIATKMDQVISLLTQIKNNSSGTSSSSSPSYLGYGFSFAVSDYLIEIIERWYDASVPQTQKNADLEAYKKYWASSLPGVQSDSVIVTVDALADLALELCRSGQPCVLEYNASWGYYFIKATAPFGFSYKPSGSSYTRTSIWTNTGYYLISPIFATSKAICAPATSATATVDLTGINSALTSISNKLTTVNSNLDTIGENFEDALSSLDGINTKLGLLNAGILGADGELGGLIYLLTQMDATMGGVLANTASISSSTAVVANAFSNPLSTFNLRLSGLDDGITDAAEYLSSISDTLISIEDTLSNFGGGGGGSSSIEDALIDELNENWLDNLDAQRDDVVYILNLFENTMLVNTQGFSLDDIADYFEAWGVAR